MLSHLPRFFAVAHSQNIKTGDIPQTYTSHNSCPVRCPFHKNGCYADNFGTNFQWKRADNGMTVTELKKWVEKNTEKGALIRHNVGGDIAIPGTSNVSPLLLGRLLDAFTDRKAYSYTHCEITEENAEFLRYSNSHGFVISFSCETVEEVDKARALGVPAVLTVTEFPTASAVTPEGHFLVPCPAQTHEGMTCKKCRLCANPNRDSVVCFLAHGNQAKKARAAIEQKITVYK